MKRNTSRGKRGKEGGGKGVGGGREVRGGVVPHSYTQCHSPRHHVYSLRTPRLLHMMFLTRPSPIYNSYVRVIINLATFV